jgi:hypothetical protein
MSETVGLELLSQRAISVSRITHTCPLLVTFNDTHPAIFDISVLRILDDWAPRRRYR